MQPSKREAEVLAALNHPNIAAIYGFEKTPDVTALVMELVEGEDLSQRIARSAIPLNEALPIAKQIADALEAAHAQNIIHRDRKPANIKVRSDGTVKVLDFGLAKALGGTTGATPAAMLDDNAPTVLSPTAGPGATLIGTMIGTAAYMAPEQAKGKPADTRADIWAFGVVLWEMVTGRRLFAGASISETLADVLKHEPDLALVPAAVRRLLRSCLEKDPKRRLHDISDARLLLDDAPLPAAPSARPQRAWLPWVIAALASIALAVTSVVWMTRPAPASRVIRFTLPLPPGTLFNTDSAAAVSPDGRYVVFSAAGPTVTSLWLQSLDSTTARPLAGTDDANRPFWSPDSRSIVFNVRGGPMKRLDIVGGAAQVLGDIPGTSPTGGGAWGRDGSILFGTTTALYRLSDTGGTPQTLTKSDAARQETHFRFPEFLPDGKRFLYWIGSPNPDVEGTYLGSLERPNERVRIMGGKDKAIYAPPRDGEPAYLLFLRDQSLLAQRFDVDARRLDGEPIRVTDGFPTSPGSRDSFWLSDAGLLVYRIGGQNQNRKLTWIARGDGKRVDAAPEGWYQVDQDLAGRQGRRTGRRQRSRGSLAIRIRARRQNHSDRQPEPGRRSRLVA